MTDHADLLDDAALEASSVVANNAMNRERQLVGVNSYARELGFNPVELLGERLDAGAPTVAWLDLCCGSGRALAQAATLLDTRATLVGIDLVDTFVTTRATLVHASATSWIPDRAFDLITCVHGLHYVGDKLAVLARAAGWLTPTGRFVADLDPANIRLPRGKSATRVLRTAGFTYHRHRITRTGPGHPNLPYTYLGADDHAGANYTGQPAVTSHYAALAMP